MIHCIRKSKIFCAYFVAAEAECIRLIFILYNKTRVTDTCSVGCDVVVIRV